MPAKINKPDKKDFEENYSKMTNLELSSLYKVSPSLIRDWIKYFGFKGKKYEQEIKIGDKIGCYKIINFAYKGKWNGRR